MSDDLSLRLYSDLLALCDSYRGELTAHQFAQLVTEFCRFDAAGEVYALTDAKTPPNVVLLDSRRRPAPSRPAPLPPPPAPLPPAA